MTSNDDKTPPYAFEIPAGQLSPRCGEGRTDLYQ
jgi:hypothetical protein